MIALDFINVQLRDNQSAFGGTESSTETLGEFIDSIGVSPDTDMESVNIDLVECGIEPIRYRGMVNCRYAVRFPDDHDCSVEEQCNQLYFSNWQDAFASLDKLVEKYGIEELYIEDIKNGITIKNAVIDKE